MQIKKKFPKRQEELLESRERVRILINEKRNNNYFQSIFFIYTTKNLNFIIIINNTIFKILNKLLK